MDVFDFRSLAMEEKITLLLRTEAGEKSVEIRKEETEDPGLVFENDLMSDYRRCSNNCIFCFIDQMPEGMRETLYFKDDDSRLSFLQGNYITLTNMKEEEIQRIIRYHLSPMNISVHTTNPLLRVSMLKNRFAGEVLKYLEEFYEAGIAMNAQIVLCKNWNDGEELQRTLEDLYRYVPVLQSLSIVPVGLTKYREGLTELLPFDEKDAENVIRLVEEWQVRAFSEHGIHYVHASDEFYLLAGRDFPPEETYDDYPQLENGVGMARLLLTEAEAELKKLRFAGIFKKRITFATGLLAAPILEKINESVKARFPKQNNRIIGITNDFFGEKITVAGLVTGQDLINRLKNKDLGELLIIPSSMLRSGETVFLDDVTLEDVKRALHIKIAVLKSDGASLIHAMTGRLKKRDLDLSHSPYELK